MKIAFKFFFKVLLFILLTAATQIGGLVYVISSFITKKTKWNFKFKSSIIYILVYLFSTFLIVPYIAPIFGREKVIHTNKISPTNYFTIILNRNYVTPKLNKLLLSAAKKLEKTSIKIHYLDANFPFINKFPLLPHLSHSDGKKIDLSLIYETKIGKISDQQKSISGYGVFEDPKPNEYNQINVCLKKGYFQYDFPKYITLGKINNRLKFSHKGNKQLIKALLSQKELGKIFIEPHLKNRLQLNHKKIRYHGCQAVRHDDHIHVQL